MNMSAEVWAARDIANDTRVAGYLRNAHVDVLAEHGPVADSLEKLRVRRERLIDGPVLRSVITTKRADATGNVRTTTTTTEATELLHGPLARSLFQIPAGFTTAIFPPEAPFRTPAESVKFAEIGPAADMSIKASLRRALCDP
jgi:hypothetical protein